MSIYSATDALGGQVACCHPTVRIRRTGNVATNRRKIKLQHALVVRADHSVSPKACFFRIVLDQLNLLLLAPSQSQVVQGMLVDVKHGGRSAKFWGHIGNSGAVPEGQCRCSWAEKFQIGRDHALRPQKLRYGEHDVGSGDARLPLSG